MTLVTQQLGGLQITLLGALGDPCNTGLLHLLLAHADIAVAVLHIVLRLGVRGDDALEVTQDNLAGSLGNQVVGHDGSLAAAAGGVHHEGGDAVAGGMAAQSFHDLDALGNRGTEVAQAQGRVAGVNVVRTDADANKLVDQLLHYMHAVVHAGEQNALVTEGDTGVSQHGAGLGGFFGDFVGMIDAGADVNAKDDRGRTALMRACLLGQDRCVEVLLDAGARINDQDEVGRSALMEACIAFKRDTIHLLLERNADVNLFDNNGVTALMRAAYGGYPSLVEKLLAYGADKDMTDKQGNVALDYVREHCRAQLEPILR